MSILIRGMSMPKTCIECPCHDMNEEWCGICYANYVIKGCKFGEALKIDWFGSRPIGCPLTEVPEFFSDLIERDAVLNVCEFIGERNDMEYLGNDNYAARADEIEKIPAVIRKDD